MARLLVVAFVLCTVLALGAGSAAAASDCVFVYEGDTMTLQSDCTTDATIAVPDGYTLDGKNHTITAVDPSGGHFLGAIVRNGGAVASVTRLTVTASGLANVCDGAGSPDNRLRGILLDEASGSITGNTIVGVNQGASGCQEGNSIEVRNFGTAPTTAVEIAGNLVLDYQKTGIVVNGDVVANVQHNRIGASATQANLAANGLQIGFGAGATVSFNQIAGNQWCGPSDYAATAVLLYQSAAGTTVSKNNVGGNADIGIYAYGDDLTVDNNRVFDDGSIGDCNQYDYDYGIGNWGNDNDVTNNKVRGYDTPYDGVTDGSNKAIPGGPIG